jgi:hypothetical protein
VNNVLFQGKKTWCCSWVTRGWKEVDGILGFTMLQENNHCSLFSDNITKTHFPHEHWQIILKKEFYEFWKNFIGNTSNEFSVWQVFNNHPDLCLATFRLFRKWHELYGKKLATKCMSFFGQFFNYWKKNLKSIKKNPFWRWSAYVKKNLTNIKNSLNLRRWIHKNDVYGSNLGGWQPLDFDRSRSREFKADHVKVAFCPRFR